MAIWQVACFLIRKEMPIFLDTTFLQSLQELGRTFPEEKSWCDSLKQYGKCDSTCMEIDISDKGTIDSVYLRIDLRSISNDQLQIISEFARKNDLLIKYNDALYDACADSFAEIIKISNAYRFLSDPQKFFEQLL